MCNGVSFSVVAESVLHKEGHMLDGVKLRVKEQVQRRNVTQPKFYKNKVFVTGKETFLKNLFNKVIKLKHILSSVINYFN